MRKHFFLDFSRLCVRCSSRCEFCDISGADSVCLLCRSSFLYRNQCFTVNPLSHSSALQANIDLLFSSANISIKEPEEIYSKCKISKKNFSKICTGCESNHYLYNKDCVKCPPYSTSCTYLKQSKKTKILDCSSEYFHNPKLQKCVKCPSNCNRCDPAKCLSCHSGFTLFAGKCISCSDPNCNLCSENSVCIACQPSFFLDKSTNKCTPCPPFCKFCFSQDKCILCLPDYIKTPNNTCKKDCNQLEYFDTKSNKCKACQSCEFCWLGTATDCSSCDLCKQKCQIHFARVSKKKFVFSSPGIIFPKVSEIRFTSPSKQSIEIFVSDNKLVFHLLQHTTTKIYLDSTSFTRKLCHLPVTVPLLISSIDSSLLSDQVKMTTISRILSYTKKSSKAGLVLLGISPQSVNYSSLILMMNLNSLYWYSLINNPPVNGVSYFLHKLIFYENLESALRSPFNQKYALYAALKTNEFNIRIEPILSLTLYVTLFMVFVFVYFSFFFTTKTEIQVKELYPLFLKNHMNKPFMRRFFKVYSKKISTEKMILIQQHFKNIKQILKTSKANLYRRKCFRFVYNGRYKIMFMFFQSICIGLIHLCVKCSKMKVIVPVSGGFILLTFLYHILLTVFICIILFRIEELSHFLPLYVKRSKFEYIKEYIFFCTNAPFIFFSMLYVYVVFLFSNLLSSDFVFLVLLISYLTSLTFEVKKLGMAKKYILVRMLSNVPVFLVFQTANLRSIGNDSVINDFLIVFLNLWKVFVLIYEVRTKMYDDIADRIIEKYSALNGLSRAD